MITISNSGREFEPHHRSPLTKTMIDNWPNERNIVIENWHINNSRKDDRELQATKRPIAISYKDNKEDFDERKDYSHIVQKIIEVEKVRSSLERQENNNRKDDIIETIQKNPSAIIQKKKLNIIDEDKVDIINGDKEK